MKKQTYLSDEYINKLSYDVYLAQKYNTGVKKKRSLKGIMERNLTEVQRKCIILYYVKNKKMKDIAKILNIDTSTVSRNIKQAKDIIFREYYEKG